MALARNDNRCAAQVLRQTSPLRGASAFLDLLDGQPSPR